MGGIGKKGILKGRLSFGSLLLDMIAEIFVKPWTMRMVRLLRLTTVLKSKKYVKRIITAEESRIE